MKRVKQMSKEPQIIQGGMGVGVSSIELSRTVSMHGELGVVSGTALAVTLARRLQEKDCDPKIIDAINAFPYPKMAKNVLDAYHFDKINQKGKDRYKSTPMPSVEQSTLATELMIIANFIEVYLAKKDHGGLIGVNLLEKVQIPTLPSLYGAMLADVDYVLMGAGIPIRIPMVLDRLAKQEDVSLPLRVLDEKPDQHAEMSFSPKAFANGEAMPHLKRPKFLAIISSHTLALHLSRSDFGSPDGFVVELPIAGGHNAQPRGKVILNADGEPIYGPRDEVDYEVLKKIGLPFWLAGGFGSREDFLRAKELGAEGIQVGTAFAFAKESGLKQSLKERIIKAVLDGKTKIKTDPLASPTGFPFKIVDIEDTNGNYETYLKRNRICDLGYLRDPYRKENGTLGYRCPSEPEDAYVAKGGKLEDTFGRRCLCNGLVSDIGLEQIRKNGDIELPLVTAGDDLKFITRFLKPGKTIYDAIDVLKVILGPNFKKLNLAL
jgi:nitronate monooxygenase